MGDQKIDYVELGIKFWYKEETNKAFDYYQKEVDAGNLGAYRDLGHCYYIGKGVSKDYNKAFECYQKAIKAGNLYAYRDLGECYWLGRGVNINYDKAFECYQKAFDAGILDACRDLGDCYWLGRGVKKNKLKAIEYYELDEYKPKYINYDKYRMMYHLLNPIAGKINHLCERIDTIEKKIDMLPITGAKDYVEACNSFESNVDNMCDDGDGGVGIGDHLSNDIQSLNLDEKIN